MALSDVIFPEAMQYGDRMYHILPLPNLVRVKYGWQYRAPWVPTSHLPDLARFSDDYAIPITKSFKDFWFELFRIQQPNWTEQRLMSALMSVGKGDRAYTNKAGLETDDAKYMTFGVAGNVLERAGSDVFKWGEWQVPVKTIDPRNLPDPKMVNRWTRPELVHAATVLTDNQLPDGTYEVWPFHQLGGADVPVPIMSYGGVNYIRRRYVDDIDYIPSPYHP